MHCEVVSLTVPRFQANAIDDIGTHVTASSLYSRSRDYRDKDAVATCSCRGGRLTSLSCSQRGFTICESGELPSGLSRCDVATRKRRPPTLSPALRMLRFSDSFRAQQTADGRLRRSVCDGGHEDML